MSLDGIDTQLYEELKRDGRATMQQLAESIGLSRVAVRSRVARLVESGHLRIIGIVHPSAQGVTTYAHLSIIVDGAAHRVGEILTRRPDISLVSLVAGRASLIAEVHATSPLSLAECVHDVRQIQGVTHVDTAVYTERIKDLYAPPGINITIGVDSIDEKILQLLVDDGRTSYATIAESTGQSPSTARTRVRRLIDHGVVRISTVLAPGVVGLEHMCGIAVRLRGDFGESVRAIEQLESVSYLSLTMSRWDAIGTLLVSSHTELVEQLDTIREMPGVETLQSWIHLKVLKENQHLTAFARPFVASRPVDVRD